MVINEYSPNIILNCSGYTNVDLAEDEFEKANLINNTSVALIAKIAKEIDALLIHISQIMSLTVNQKIHIQKNSNTNPIEYLWLNKITR